MDTAYKFQKLNLKDEFQYILLITTVTKKIIAMNFVVT